MRIAYLCFEDFSVETGVAKKICLQAGKWQAAGHEVALFAPRLTAARITAAEELQIVEFDFALGAAKYFDPGGMGIREVSRFAPDIVYNRYFILPPWHLRLATEFNLVFEVNSEESEFTLYHSRVKLAFHKLWKTQYQRSAAGAIFISRELSEKPDFRRFRQRAVIANGIECPQTSPTQFCRKPGPPRLFFIGDGQLPWHGVDKIGYIARHLPDVHIDVVGVRAPDENLPNIRYHGRLARHSYEPLIRDADVAIGPLSLHTKSLSEASPLKVREYLASGVPTVIAYRDTDIPPNTAMTLHIPNTPDNVSTNIARIASFIHSARGRRIEWNSVTSLDATTKEQQRLDFFTECVVRNRRAA